MTLHYNSEPMRPPYRFAHRSCDRAFRYRTIPFSGILASQTSYCICTIMALAKARDVIPPDGQGVSQGTLTCVTCLEKRPLAMWMDAMTSGFSHANPLRILRARWYHVQRWANALTANPPSLGLVSVWCLKWMDRDGRVSADTPSGVRLVAYSELHCLPNRVIAKITL